MGRPGKLIAIKAIHTLAWGFFAGCIIAIPFAVHAGRLDVAAVFAGIVFLEVLVLAINGGRCPLTAVAARYTPDREDNFDIFLPLWVARYNKHVFGSMYVVALLYLLVAWAGNRGVA